MTSSQPVEFEVAPPALGYAVSVLLRNVTGRWLAVAECLDGRHIGLGATARDALVSAFAPLGARTAAILMADPALFGASIHVLAN
jgi:uncharacterized membrane protein